MDYQWYVDNFNKERQYYGSAEPSSTRKGMNDDIQVPHYEVESSDEDDLDAFLNKFSSIPDEEEQVVTVDEFVPSDSEEEDEGVISFGDAPSEEDENEVIDYLDEPSEGEEEYEIIGSDEPSNPEEEEVKKTAFDKYGDEIDQLIDKYREVIE